MKLNNKYIGKANLIGSLKGNQNWKLKAFHLLDQKIDMFKYEIPLEKSLAKEINVFFILEIK